MKLLNPAKSEDKLRIKMFDANAAHIPVGELFFVEVHCVDSQLKEHGIKQGDIILCQHVEKSKEVCRENLISNIFTGIESDPFDWIGDFSRDDWSWMVYSGRPNGNDFIDNKWKAKALAFLGGKWIS